jgi:hypothetical protein
VDRSMNCALRAKGRICVVAIHRGFSRSTLSHSRRDHGRANRRKTKEPPVAAEHLAVLLCLQAGDWI